MDKANQFNPFLGPEIELIIPITKAQSEILIDCDLGGNDAKRAYNISYSLKFTGDLNFNALEDAVKYLIERHESLRASFSKDARFMCIYSDFPVDISYSDISTQVKADKQKSLNLLIREEANYIFDLINGPLLKITVVKSGVLEYFLVFTLHHTICDGLSINTFLKELAAVYSAYIDNKTPHLPEPIPFSIFAEKENLFTESLEYKNSEAFWLNMFHAPVPKVELPIDYARPSIR